MDTDKKLDAYVILGSSPEEPGLKSLEVYLHKQGADAYLLNGLMHSFAQGMQQGDIVPGSTVSLIVTLGEETDENPFPSSSGSFVINSPTKRSAWDFVVQPHDITPKP